MIFHHHHHHHHHLSLNHWGHWAPKMIPQPFSSIFPVLHCPLGLGELQACPFPDVVFPPLPLSALSSSPFHCALQDGFGQTWWTGYMTIPLQFASLYNHQEIFMWFNCLLDLCTDFLDGNMVFVCVVFCGSTSFPFFAALLSGSMIYGPVYCYKNNNR